MLNMLLKSCAAFVKYNSIFINGFSFLFPTFNHHFQTQLPHHFLSAAAACLWVIAQVYRQKWHESRSVGTRDLDPLLRALVPVTPAQLQLHTPVMISHTISLNEFSFLSSPCQGHIHSITGLPQTHIRGFHRIWRDLSSIWKQYMVWRSLMFLAL